MQGELIIHGATEHNLKDINVVIPKGKFVVITGVSGSGKSTLVFDVLYKEAQRRYLNTLSSSVRKEFPPFAKPKVKAISGLSPALALKQQQGLFSSRSTVGTLTEIYDFLRVLYAKIGIPHCPQCGKPLSVHTIPEIVQEILSLPKGERIILLAPLPPSDKKEWWKDYLKDGFIKVKVNGRIYDLTEEEPPAIPHNPEVIIDRLIVKPGIETRLRDSVELALKLSGGKLKVELPEKETLFFSLKAICPQCGFNFPPISPTLFSFNSPLGACHLCQGLGKTGEQVCPACVGKRLRPEALAVKIAGEDISSLAGLSITEMFAFFDTIVLTSRQKKIAEPIWQEMKSKAGNLQKMGLGYLTLNQSISELATGEYRRLLLAMCINSSLSDVIFILDEPTTGLHPKEVEQLITCLRALKDLGNTVIVVEHDLQVILSADYVIEIGPGSEEKGGRITFTGTPLMLKESDTITGQYLSGKKRIYQRKKFALTNSYLVIERAAVNNLKDITVKIPLNRFTCVCGVSGSGKSSLIIGVLYQYLKQHLYGKKKTTIGIDSIKGIEKVKHVVLVDARPITRGHRSNPATYTGIFNYIRQLFAKLPEARARGYTPDRFSLNVKGGRCESCQGEGVIKIEMPFLPDVYLTCEACQGKRFNEDTLEIKFKGKNIADVLDMTAIEAYEFFRHIPQLKRQLGTLVEVGLGYLHLGQPVSTLSGGEVQRLKLAKELSRKNARHTIYILDEPTMGLHLEDINHLLLLLDRLIARGHTVIVIEHHPEIIKAADYIIELGPEGGQKGGYLLRSEWA